MRKRLAAVIGCALFAGMLAASVVPRPSQELQIQMPGAKPIALSQYKGKAVVLAFILTTCSHCQYTTGLLVKMQNEFGPKGLQVLECAVNNNADTLIPAFVQQFKTNFPVGYNYDQDYILGPFLQHEPDKVPGMPILVFIDRRGVIRAEYEGHDDFISSENQEQNIRGEIQKLLVPRK
jgi:thiol-disulfide isomerase/thioredoxin